MSDSRWNIKRMSSWSTIRKGKKNLKRIEACCEGRFQFRRSWHLVRRIGHLCRFLALDPPTDSIEVLVYEQSDAHLFFDTSLFVVQSFIRFILIKLRRQNLGQAWFLPARASRSSSNPHIVQEATKMSSVFYQPKNGQRTYVKLT